MARDFLLLTAALAALALGADAQERAERPLSAIDWLSQSVGRGPARDSGANPGGALVLDDRQGPLQGNGGAEIPPQFILPDTLFDDSESSGVRPPVRDPNEAPVADTARAPEIAVTSLDRPGSDGVGLLPASVTGLPASLWSGSREDTLALLVRAENADMLPALRELFVTLLLAQADPPAGAGDGSAFFTARIDRLLDLGALEQAQALLEMDSREDPEIFRRWFDVTLLTGTEDAACAFMESRPALSPTYPARIFCLARRGDWNAAALTLSTARTLREVTPEEDALLSRFLDPALAEESAPLPPPSRPSPLVYRLREAIGEPIATGALPRAFAHADLRPVSPWRAQLEAAERLARAGAISPNVLFALYTRQTPAASGGIWDRATAIARLERALEAGDPAALGRELRPAWGAMAAIRAEVAFAEFYAERLLAAGLTGEDRALAWRIALLSREYEAAAQGDVPPGRDHALLAAVARGGDAAAGDGAPVLDPAALRPIDDREGAVIAGFNGPSLGVALRDHLDSGRLGEALLRNLGAMAAGREADPVVMTEGIGLLREVGLEDAARRAALEYLILARDD